MSLKQIIKILSQDSSYITKIPWWSDDIVIYDTQSECCFLRRDTMWAIWCIAFVIHQKFPGRTDRKLHLGDASTKNLDLCPNHPKNVHIYGKSQDIWYYKTNFGSFDTERNALFFWLIHLTFPNCVVMVSTDIKRILENYWGKGEQYWLEGDNNPEYNHDKHAHINHGGKIEDVDLCKEAGL